MEYDVYESPFTGRYSSPYMKQLFSDEFKFTTWRRLWVALAESEKELGLNITDEQIAQLKAHINDIDYAKAAHYEKELRHDVMAHIRTYGEVCPQAAGIIHLGATSSYVDDNTDIIRLKLGLEYIRRELLNVIAALAAFAEKYKDLPCLAYTHFQAAQPTTYGKRACIWLQELLLDMEEIEFQLSSLKFFGCKGTTGTCASFLELFGGDKEKATGLEKLIAAKMGFDGVYPVSGQTYSRKVDYRALSALSGIAQSATKFATDIRLLSHLKEVDEPFEEKQVGSSAMAYKRNPMRSERICSLSRYIICDEQNAAFTASAQWFERTLDDSANKRISVPEAFLAADAVLSLYRNVISGLTVYPKIVSRHLQDEIPFMATENILMYCVENKGGDRQQLHEAIREHSVAAAKKAKTTGEPNDLLERIAADSVFALTDAELNELTDPALFTGCAAYQTEKFISEYAEPLLAANKDIIGGEAPEINV